MSAETLHVVTATDENGLVREQEVWADEPEAFRRFDELRAIYGGEFVCIASRKVLGRRAPASDAGTGPRETQGERERLADLNRWLDEFEQCVRDVERFGHPSDDQRLEEARRQVRAAALRSAPPGEPEQPESEGERG